MFLKWSNFRLIFHHKLTVSGAFNHQNGPDLFLQIEITKWCNLWTHKLSNWSTDPLWSLFPLLTTSVIVIIFSCKETFFHPNTSSFPLLWYIPCCQISCMNILYRNACSPCNLCNVYNLSTGCTEQLTIGHIGANIITISIYIWIVTGIFR